MAMDEKIDFVITWVDNGDPKWRKEFEYYSAKDAKNINTKACRYRDWGTLQYWFRGVVKFAPWVNKIYFVTYGHLPKWLNVDHPKLQIVKHEDFIPKEYLPTFNSNVIEFYFHRIKGLSDRFVYFNDDTFLIDSVSPDRFFKDGLPCDIGGFSYIKSKGMFGCSVYRAVDLIKDHFKKKEVISQNRSKWYSFEYPKVSLHNLLMYRQPVFTGFRYNHLPQGYLKSIYDDVWASCREDLDWMSAHRFRTWGDITSWLIRYWQLASGRFTPYNIYKDGIYREIKDSDIDKIIRCIRNQEKRMICLNDTNNIDFDVMKQKIQNAFEHILPEKSSFEKY